MKMLDNNSVYDSFWNLFPDPDPSLVWDSVLDPSRLSVWLSFCGLVRWSVLKEFTNENDRH